MDEEVYNYLKEYGFSDEELDSFQEENDKMFFTDLEEVKKNTSFLEGKKLTKDEIINLLKINPFMITVKDNRLKALEQIYYNVLKVNDEELKQLLIDNSDAFIASPIELQKNIDYMSENKCSHESIKKFILSNPKVINMYLDEFKKIVKFKKGNV